MKALIEAVHLPPGKKERKCVIKLLLALSTYDVMFEKESAEEKNEEERDESIENEVCTLSNQPLINYPSIVFCFACLFI